MTDLLPLLLLRNSIGTHDDDDARALRQRAHELGATDQQCAEAVTERDRYLAETVTVWTGGAIDAAHIAHQQEWSEATFGPGLRTKGVCDHIRKELIEIQDDPSDVREWVDVILLAFDGAWRTGATPEEIIAAVKAKQARNEARTWPDWRTADPDKAIEHDRSAEDAA